MGIFKLDRAIITSDWHADAVTMGRSRYAEICETAMSIAEDAIRLAGGDRRTFFVFAGDLTDPDTPRCWRAAKLAVEVARRLDRSGVPSIWMTGNHDVMEDGFGSHSLMPIAGLSASAQTYSLVSDVPGMAYPFGTGDVGVLCFPYVARSGAYDPEYIVNAVPKDVRPRLIVGHLMLEGISVGSETKDFARGRDVFLPIELLQKRWPGVPICNGHYHTGMVYRGIHVIGSPVLLTVADQGNPRYLEVDV